MSEPRLVVTRRSATGLLMTAPLWAAGVAASPAHAAAPVERADLYDVFRKAGVEGSMAIVMPAGSVVTINGGRAKRRFVPASTFKLTNSLIALETGVVKDEREVIPYGGKPQPNPQWQRDMSMAEALPMSNVPIYQEIARRIGLARYREWLTRLDYGNHDVGAVVDRFWLDGPLEISAIEQAHFAARLAHGTLPLSARAQTIVADIARLESNDGGILYGKTGWTGRKLAIGWITGWHDIRGQITAFSLNIDMPEVGLAPKRLSIAREVLDKLSSS